MATSAIPEGPNLPAAPTAIDELAGEYLDAQPNPLQRQSALEWLKKLHHAATLHQRDWYRNIPLVLLARELGQRDTLASLDSVAEIQYAALYDGLLANLQELPASACRAARRDGTYCAHRAANGLFYCLQHRRHGIVALARRGSQPSVGQDPFVCFCCGSSSADHPCDSTSERPAALRCYTCMATVATQCAVDAAGRELSPSVAIQCSTCAEHRGRFGLLLSTDETRDGEPTCPEYVVLPVHPGLLPATPALTAPVPATGDAPQSLLPLPIANAQDTVAPASTSSPAPAPPAPTNAATQDAVLQALLSQVQSLAAVVQRLQDSEAARTAATSAEIPSGATAQPAATAPTPGPERAVEIPAATELLTASGERPHPWGNTALATRIAYFAGRKNNVDASGNPLSSPHNFLNPRYGQFNDYLACNREGTGKTSLELHGFQCSPLDDIPDQLAWENYIASYLDWHWRLLHVVDSPVFDQGTPEGRLRAKNVLTVIARCRYIYALAQALRYRVPGRPELTWPRIYDYLKRYAGLFYTNRPVTVYDQFFPKIIDEQERLLQDGAPPPSFHDELEQQLIAAARGHLQTSWLAAPGEEEGDKKPKPKCALCLGAHRTSNHPDDAPITQPCTRCGHPHAMIGRHATKCPEGPAPKKG